MMNQIYQFMPMMSGNYNVFMLFPWWLLVIAVIWTLPWKGVALWKAARNCQIEWFVVLLLVNTLAILEILYLVFWQKKRECCGHENGEEKKRLFNRF